MSGVKGSTRHWLSRLDWGWRIWIVTAAGVGLVVAATIGGVGWPAVLLDAGLTLCLAAALHLMDTALTRRLEARVDSVRETVETVERSVSRLANRIEGVGARAIAERAERHQLLLDTFRQTPTPETWKPIGQELRRFKNHGTIELYPDNAYGLLITPTDEYVHIEIYKVAGRIDGPVQGRTSQCLDVINWQEPTTIHEFYADLLDRLAQHGLYPGDQRATDYDFVGAVADAYTTRFTEIFPA